MVTQLSPRNLQDTPSKSASLFADASQRLENALQYVSISEDAIERLRYPKASLAVSIPVRVCQPLAVQM